MTQPPSSTTDPAVSSLPGVPARSVHPQLHPQLVDAATTAVTLLQNLLGSDLLSLSIVGHPVQEGLRKDERVETVLVLQGGLLDHAQRIGTQASGLAKHHLAPPLLMTRIYIERSLDVFPIEYLHMQLLHHTASGQDPFGELVFDKTHVRLQCEREAKRYLLHIREGLMRSRGKDTALRQVTHELLAAVIPLMGGVLFLKDVERPVTRLGLIQQIDQDPVFSMSAFSEILNDVIGRQCLSSQQLVTVLRDSYRSLENLSEWLDADS